MTLTEISGATTVRDLLHEHPGVFPVFLGHGMCEDCKADPPPVPLAHFASKHCDGELALLLSELRQAMGAPDK